MTEFEAFPTDFARIDEVGIVVLTVPKGAHSSIMTALAQTFARLGETHKQATQRWRAHGSRDVPAGYLSVGFCRDPMTRFRSCWQNKIANVDVCRTELAAIGCRPNMSLDEFSELVAETEDRDLDKHLTPQHYKFFVDGKLRVQNLYRFEELATAWDGVRELVRAHCGRDLADLPRLNASSPFPVAWSERSRGMIRERYATDRHILSEGLRTLLA